MLAPAEIFLAALHKGNFLNRRSRRARPANIVFDPRVPAAAAISCRQKSFLERGGAVCFRNLMEC
jgi:hypothetical protein